MSSNVRRLVARGRIAAVPVAAVAALAGALGATGASAKQGHAAAASSKATLAKAAAEVRAAQQAPKWYAPGPKVNARKALHGKTIVTFPISSEIDACNTSGQQGYLDAEAKALGARVIPLQSNTGPAGWNQDLTQAITDKANAGVMLCGPTAGLSAESGVNTSQGLQVDLADALVNLKGKPAKILFLDSPQVAQDSGAL